jgi:hypothetical protein
MSREKIRDNFESPLLEGKYNNNKGNNKQQQQGQGQNFNMAHMLSINKKILKDDEVAINKDFVKIILLANFIICAVLFPYVVGWIDFTAEIWEIMGVTAAYVFIGSITYFVMKLTKTDLSPNR